MYRFLWLLLLFCSCIGVAELDAENERLRNENHELQMLLRITEEQQKHLVEIQDRVCEFSQYLLFTFRRLGINEVISDIRFLVNKNCKTTPLQMGGK